MSQGVCPACKSGRFTQTRDLQHFKCADCGKEFVLTLVRKRERVVLRGGKEKDYAITVEHLGVKEE